MEFPEGDWRPIPGYEGIYWVSASGMICSAPRRGTRGGLAIGTVGERGYRMVNLLGKKRAVHSIVAEVFIGPRPQGLEVCHCNGEALDNRAVNLRYDTPSANTLDRVKHGTHHMSRRSHCKNGHLFALTGKRAPNGQRRCLECERDRNRRRRAK